MLVYIKLVLTALFWGGTFVAGRIVAREVGPFSASFLRFLTASVFLALILWRVEGRIPIPGRNRIFPLVLLGLTGVFSYNVFFFLGLERIEAGRASLIIANNPVFITLFSALIFRDRLPSLAVLGILCSLLGAAVVITRGDVAQALQGGAGLGELFIFCCVLSWVAYSLIGKAVLVTLSPLVTVSWAAFIGTAALLVPACLEGLTGEFLTFPASSWFGILYLGLFGTVAGFVWYYRGIQEIGPARASQFINLVPVSAVLLASIILDEPLGLSLVAGGVLVLSGITLTNRAVRARRTDAAAHRS
ncbi:MAG: DMT family transporter [Thermodesulfobacteriota bacterium]